MDAQTFLEDLKEYATQFEIWWCKPYTEFYLSHLLSNFINSAKATGQFEGNIRKEHDLIREIYNYLDENYDVYINATAEERAEIRLFFKSTYYRPILGATRYMRRYMVTLLLIYVKQHVLPKLKSTKDPIWLYRGLVALSMDNLSGKFDDKSYIAYSMKGDAVFLLTDLWVTAEESKIDQEQIFHEIGNISSDKEFWDKSWGHVFMNEMITGGGNGKLAEERRTYGKFMGLE